MAASVQIVDSPAAVSNIGSEPGLGSPEKLPQLPDLGDWAAGQGDGRGPQVQDVQDGPAVRGREQPGEPPARV